MQNQRARNSTRIGHVLLRRSAWWQVAGQTCVAAYQPKGAASLAASYVNLANPGTYDAAPGVAPTWAAGTGWTFDGSTTYLTTGVMVAKNQVWTLAVRMSDLSAGDTGSRAVLGSVDTASYFVALNSGFYNRVYMTYGTNTDTTIPKSAVGVMVMAGREMYVNGVHKGTIVANAPGGVQDKGLYIGARNNSNNVPSNFHDNNAKVQAVAIYSTTLSAAEVAALTTRMQAL